MTSSAPGLRLATHHPEISWSRTGGAVRLTRTTVLQKRRSSPGGLGSTAAGLRRRPTRRRSGLQQPRSMRRIRHSSAAVAAREQDRYLRESPRRQQRHPARSPWHRVRLVRHPTSWATTRPGETRSSHGPDASLGTSARPGLRSTRSTARSNARSRVRSSSCRTHRRTRRSGMGPRRRWRRPSRSRPSLPGSRRWRARNRLTSQRIHRYCRARRRHL